MLMPTFSVTGIGLLVAVAAMVIRHAKPGRSLLLGVVGAWVGFVAGAIAGVLVDVVAGTGWVLAFSGHLAAFAAAAGLVFSRRVVPASPIDAAGTRSIR